MYMIGYLLLNIGVYTMLLAFIVLALIHIQNGLKLFARVVMVSSIMITIGTIMVNWS